MKPRPGDHDAVARSGVRLHAFALISGIGWIIDFCLFNLLALAGMSLLLANIIGAGCAVSFVFVTGRRFIFRDVQGSVWAAIAAYAAWNIVAILLASAAIAFLGRMLSTPEVLALARRAMCSAGVRIDPELLAAPASKIALTPVTMYCNYVAMGMIIERRIHFW